MFELKICKGKSLPFDAVAEHQERALKLAKDGLLVFKIPDSGMGAKPFDCFALGLVEAFVVVQFYARGVKHFYLIDVDKFIEERESSKRKSLVEERAKQIGELGLEPR